MNLRNIKRALGAGLPTDYVLRKLKSRGQSVPISGTGSSSRPVFPNTSPSSLNLNNSTTSSTAAILQSSGTSTVNKPLTINLSPPAESKGEWRFVKPKVVGNGIVSIAFNEDLSLSMQGDAVATKRINNQIAALGFIPRANIDPLSFYRKEIVDCIERELAALMGDAMAIDMSGVGDVKTLRTFVLPIATKVNNKLNQARRVLVLHSIKQLISDELKKFKLDEQFVIYINEANLIANFNNEQDS